jgi:hypothetical protein
MERAAILLALRYGNLDPQIGMAIDQIFAELGRYDKLPATQADFVTGKPLIWANNTTNSVFLTPDVQARIPFERASIAFGCQPDNLLVGPFDIAHAMAATTADGDYRRLFTWAITHVLAQLHSTTREAVTKTLGIELIPDRDVLSPGGPLNPTYLEIAQAIRKTVSESRTRPVTEAERRVAIQAGETLELAKHLR